MKPLLTSLFEFKAWADERLFESLRGVAAGLHAERLHTCIRLLNHIHVVDRIFAAHLRGQPHGYSGTNTPETPSLDALQAAMRACDRDYLALVAELDEAALNEDLSFTFTDGQRGRMTRLEMLMHVCTHGSNHRGAVAQLLKQIEVAPPRDTLTTFLHLSQPERRGAA